MSHWEQQAEAILVALSTSFVLNRALTSYLATDPVDAVNEVEVLLDLLTGRLDEVFAQNVKDGYLDWFNRFTIYADGVITGV